MFVISGTVKVWYEIWVLLNVCNRMMTYSSYLWWKGISLQDIEYHSMHMFCVSSVWIQMPHHYHANFGKPEYSNYNAILRLDSQICCIKLFLKHLHLCNSPYIHLDLSYRTFSTCIYYEVLLKHKWSICSVFKFGIDI